MNNYRIQSVFTVAAALTVLMFCGLVGFALFGSGLWMARSGVTAQAADEVQVVSIATLPPLPTHTATPIPTDTPTAAPTATPSPPPTATATAVPLPSATLEPTATDVPPTPVPAPPTATPLPTDTLEPPLPSFAFTVKETGTFPTGNPNFDIFIAIVDTKNKPLSGYRIIGTHSNGWQVESAVSAGDWTENSGAMHYKGGNVKYSAPNSPTGVWSLQLVDEQNTPMSAPVELTYDEDNPNWYFLIFERE